MSVRVPNARAPLRVYSDSLDELVEVLPPPKQCFSIMLGDWHFALEEEGNMFADGSGWSNGDVYSVKVLLANVRTGYGSGKPGTRGESYATGVLRSLIECTPSCRLRWLL
eukprot:8616523-Pyramimonas_sp.AAC.1